MHSYPDDEQFVETLKPWNILERSEMIDSEIVSKIFKKIKFKGIIKEVIEIDLEKENKENQINDYIDQFIYYRKLRGYTQKEVGQVIGITGKDYYKYEKRIYKFKDMIEIEKIANFLEIKEELKMLNFKERINNQQLKEYLKNKNISNSEFSRLLGVSRRSVVDWFNKNVEISEKNCKKVKAFIHSLEEKELLNKI